MIESERRAHQDEEIHSNPGCKKERILACLTSKTLRRALRLAQGRFGENSDFNSEDAAQSVFPEDFLN
jgi:hypothetical protein